LCLIKNEKRFLARRRVWHVYSWLEISKGVTSTPNTIENKIKFFVKTFENQDEKLFSQNF